MSATGAGCGKPSVCPFRNDIPLKFGKRPEDMENEFPAASGGIDVFRQALKPDVSAVQLGDPLNEVFEGAAKAIQSPHNQGIPAPDDIDRASCQSFSL